MRFRIMLRKALVIYAAAITFAHATPPPTADLDLSPEKYCSLLESLQITDTLVQTVFKIEPASALVTIEQLEFSPSSGNFLISAGTGGATLIQQLQLSEPPQNLKLSPKLAWINGNTFAFHDQSGRWHKMSRPTAPSLSPFRTLSYKLMSEVSFIKKQLLSQLEAGPQNVKGEVILAETKRLLSNLESDSASPKEFSLANERYLVKPSESGLVERLSVFEDGIVKAVVTNANTKTLSKSMQDLIAENKSGAESLSKGESDLFHKLAGKPSFGMFLVPQEKGCSIVSIDPRGPSYQAGLRKGDLISRLNGLSSANMRSDDLKLLLTESNQVTVSYIREGKLMEDIVISKKTYSKVDDLVE
jgi:hypothetical protein